VIVALDSPERLKANVTGDKVVEVTFNAPTLESDLEALSGLVELHKLGDKYRITFAGDGEPVSDLVDYARIRSLRIEALNTLRPSLEDAFLKITGTSPDEVRSEKEQQKQRRMDG